jgi:hypothetical protein
MSRRRRTQSRRGEHRKRTSPETRRWERDHLFPGKPSWMDSATYRALVTLRGRL